jgi:hypothetical protein
MGQGCAIVLILDGLVAQWTRARGYGPRCRGFESLLARFSILQINYHTQNLSFECVSFLAHLNGSFSFRIGVFRADVVLANLSGQRRVIPT